MQRNLLPLRVPAASHEHLLLTPTSLTLRPARRIPEIPCCGLLYHNRFPFLLPLRASSIVTRLSSSLKVYGGGVRTFHPAVSSCREHSVQLRHWISYGPDGRFSEDQIRADVHSRAADVVAW
jgi:hypothetical protein